jgi:hypothetical protein
MRDRALLLIGSRRCLVEDGDFCDDRPDSRSIELVLEFVPQCLISLFLVCCSSCAEEGDGSAGAEGYLFIYSVTLKVSSPEASFRGVP